MSTRCRSTRPVKALAFASIALLFSQLYVRDALSASFDDATPMLGPLVPDFTYGTTWGDLDRDGWPDLFLSNHNQRPPVVLHNESGVSFADVTVASGMGSQTDYHTCKWGDYDRDGDWDIYCTTGAVNGNGSRPARFYQNRGNGTFLDIAAGSNAGFSDARGRTASWLDIDGDGDLDLYVGTLVDDATEPSAKLFRNDGATFTDITAGSGAGLIGTVQTSIVLDLDKDNDSDLLISFLSLGGTATPCANCLLFLQNNGSGSFTVRRAATLGLNGFKAWALAAGDFDNDRDLDIFQGNGWSAAVHRNNNQTFSSLPLASIGMAGVTAWRIEDAHWADFDNDGFLDLFVVRNDAGNQTNPPDVLYLNNGNGTFRDATVEFNAAGSSAGNGDAIAVADFDGNGFLDVILAHGEGNAHGGYQLLRNTGNDNGWLRMNLVDANGSPEFGTRISVRTGSSWQYREFSDSANKVSHEPVVHFGLGLYSQADEIQIEWPNGSTSVLRNIAANQTVEIEKPTIDTLTVPPVVGLTQAAAQSAITAAGLSVGTVTSAASDTVPTGHVISQDPAAGTSVSAGSSVALVVSTGPATNGGFLEFDGVNDRVVVPNAASLRLRNAVTVEAWIQPQTVSSTNVQDRILKKGNNYELSVSTGDTGCAAGTAGHVQWRATIGGTNRRICGGLLVPGDWHHVAGTYDGSTFNLYVDGMIVASMNRIGQMATSTAALVIGNDPTGDHAFDGGIDSVAVWNRALSASELLDRATGPLTGTEVNLVSYWQFDEPSGQTAFDLAIRANHGRLGTRANADNADPIRRIAASP